MGRYFMRNTILEIVMQEMPFDEIFSKKNLTRKIYQRNIIETKIKNCGPLCIFYHKLKQNRRFSYANIKNSQTSSKLHIRYRMYFHRETTSVT